MDSITLTFNSPPFSVNTAYYRNRQRTTKCRKWGDHILDQLAQYEDQIIEFRNSVNVFEHSLSTSIYFMQPAIKLYTKSGKISRRGFDLSNIEKLFIDLVFDARFNDRGFTNLCLDDCLNVDLHSFKRVSPTDSYQIIITVQKIPISQARSHIDA